MLDEECLVEAIVAEGVERATIERSTSPMALRGWRRGEVAHVVLRRECTGDAFNDIGFLRKDTGYQAVISDDHPRFGRTWLARVTERYAGIWADRQARLAEKERRRVEEARARLVEAQRESVYARAKKLGYRVKETKQGETIRLELVKRSY